MLSEEVLLLSLHGVCVRGGVQSDARAVWGSKKTQGFIHVVYSGQKKNIQNATGKTTQ